MRSVRLLLALVLCAAAPLRLAPTIHLVGDSTMADRPTPERNPYRGWGQLLSRFVDDTIAVRNHAVNGRSTRSFIDQGRWGAVTAALRPGDYVIIQFGHNDEKRDDSTRYTDPDVAYRENLRRFVRETRAAGATPILATSIARRSFDANGALRATHGEYPRVTREVAAELQVPLLDLERSTSALVQEAGVEGSRALYGWVAPATNTMYPAGLTDDTHLSVSGATAVARLAAEALKRTDLPLAAAIHADR